VTARDPGVWPVVVRAAGDVLDWLECEMIGDAGRVAGTVECMGWNVW